MKFLFFFLTVCLAAACCSLITGDVEQKPATKEFLVRQKNLLKLLNNVHMRNFYEDQVHIGQNWRFMDHKDKFMRVDVVDDFIRFMKSGFFLPRGKIFSISNDLHRKTAISLFHMFYYAKDWTTFYNMACWAREHINEGMFVYTLTVAVLHRKDCRGLILPPPYEIYPFYFLNSEVIQKGYRLKMQETVYDQKLAEFYGVSKVDNTFFITTNYSGWALPINDETKISYFMEDIGLNSYYFYFHADYPFWMGGDIFGLKKDRRGENFLYFHKQLLARFYMERLSNDLGEIPRFFWNRPIETGFLSHLKYFNGMEFPSRPNFMNLRTTDNLYDLQNILDGEKRIRDAVYRGFVHTETGGIVKLTRPEDIEVLGNIIQGNRDSPNTRFYRYLGLISKGLLGNSIRPFDKFYTVPSVLEQYETALRDPMFYQIYQRFIHYANVYQKTLPFYRRAELDFMGVKIDDVKVDRLVTFFDFFDVDMTNAFYRKHEEVDRKKDQFMFVARQHRLNHEQFNVNIDVTSEKGGDSIVRIFLAPKYDSMRRRLDISQNRHNFFELDSFMYTLKAGRNTIVRNSREFLITSKDRTMTRDLIKRIDSSLNGGTDFMLDMSEAHNGFPNRLILPRGKEMGMEFMFFVMVSPWRQPKVVPEATRFDHVITAGVGTGDRFFSGDALGFPFDRRIVKSEFFTPNMFFKDVLIYHRSLKSKNTPFYTRDQFMNKRFMDVDTIRDTGFVKTNTNFMDKSFVEPDFVATRGEFYDNDRFYNKY